MKFVKKVIKGGTTKMLKDQPQTAEVLKIISELVEAAEYMNMCAE